MIGGRKRFKWATQRVVTHLNSRRREGGIRDVGGSVGVGLLVLPKRPGTCVELHVALIVLNGRGLLFGRIGGVIVTTAVVVIVV